MFHLRGDPTHDARVVESWRYTPTFPTYRRTLEMLKKFLDERRQFQQIVLSACENPIEKLRMRNACSAECRIRAKYRNILDRNHVP